MNELETGDLMTQSPLISLKHVSLEYKDTSLFGGEKRHRVLDDISLNILPGETLGIVGRNGAGKSSLLRLLAGVIDPDEGEIQRGDQRTVLLSYQLGFNKLLTGRSNAIYSGLLLGVSRKEMESRIDDIIDFSGLGEAIDEQLVTYSAGMRARLGFAVAIQADADVILVDEALGVGDHEFRQKSMAYMKQWIQSNKTVVFVSHDETAVRSMCNRVAWIENGHVVLEGETKEVLDKYHQYDRYVETLSSALGMTELEVRNHPSSVDPIAAIEKFKIDLKNSLTINQRKSLQEKNSRTAVKFYYPGISKLQLSHLVVEEGGETVWIESTLEVLRGSHETVIPLYNEFLGVIHGIAKTSKQDVDVLRVGGLNKKLVKLLVNLKEEMSAP